MAATSEAIHRMLISRLERQIEDLKKANDALVRKIKEIRVESPDQIHPLEAERNASGKSIEHLDGDLEDAKSRLRRIEGLDTRKKRRS